MMSKFFLHITCYTLIAFLVSCAGEAKYEDYSESESTETAKNADNQLLPAGLKPEQQNLSAEQLEAFQVRAIQKFKDFTDYVKIITDKEVDSKLAQHSLNLIGDLFINDSTSFEPKNKAWGFETVDSNNTSPVLLMDFIKHYRLVNHVPKIIIQTQNIKFISPLQLDSTNVYQGQMKATLKVNGKKTAQFIDVHIVDVEKNFGDASQNILEVRLGNIY